MGLKLTLDYYSISLLIGGFTALLSGFVVYIHNKKRLENTAWLYSNLTSAVWSFGYFSMITATMKEVAEWSNIILHIASIYIPIFYFLAVSSITGTYEKYKKKILILSLMGSVFAFFVPTAWFVRDVIPKAHFNFVCDAGPLYIYYTVYFFAVVLYALSVVVRSLKNEHNPINRQRYKYIILFTIFGFGGGGSVFFLTFNIPILPYPLIFFSLYPAVSGYVIFRYQLFNVKVITTELLVFVLWIFLLIRTVIAQSIAEVINNGAILLLTIIVGIFIIRSVIKEVHLREKIEKLAKDLEVANEKLKELDKLKSEFLSLATHQIRAPLTAIKGYSSMLTEGDFGVLPQKARDAASTIMKSCQNLIDVVADFLDISRIEQGRMVYEKSVFEITDLLRETAEGLRPNIQKAGLQLILDVPNGFTAHINGDKNKIKQVIGNILDNAIKYTIRGDIKISLERDGNRVRIAIKDSGVGIDPAELGKLFVKFSRTKDANKTNISGTGLGLYLAKKIVEAHSGSVRASSEGIGKGTTFTIELPANF